MNILVILSLFAPLAAGQLVWERLHFGNESLAPVPREDASLAHDSPRNRLIMFGGTGGGILDDTWSFDLGTGQWTELQPNTKPTPRFSMVFGISGDYFYVSTGESRDRVFLNDIWRFDLVNDEWEQLPIGGERPTGLTDAEWDVRMRDALKPEYRYGSAGGIFPGTSSFFVSLGFSGTRYFNTFRYDVDRMHWIEEHDGVHPYNPSYPHGRCLHGGTMVSEFHIVIFGGCLTGGGTGGPCPSGDSWMFDNRDKSWERLDGCASPKTYSSMAMLPIVSNMRRVILYGGDEDSKQVIETTKSPADQVGVFNPDSKDWYLRQTTGDIPVKRSHTVLATGIDGIYMFGGKNEERQGSLNDLYILRGTAMTADQAPMQSDCGPTFINYILLHGIIMVMAWGCFLQWGAFIARYFRHKDPLWFKLHRFFQFFGVAISLVGVPLAFVSSSGHFKYAHSIIGVVVTVFGVIQPLNGVLRPHKPPAGEKVSMRRVVWEILHKNLGRITLVLALVQISLGVFLAVSSTAVWGTWFGYLCFIVVAYIIAELNKRCKDKEKEESTPKRYNMGNPVSYGISSKEPNCYSNPALESEG